MMQRTFYNAIATLASINKCHHRLTVHLDLDHVQVTHFLHRQTSLQKAWQEEHDRKVLAVISSQLMNSISTSHRLEAKYVQPDYTNTEAMPEMMR